MHSKLIICGLLLLCILVSSVIIMPRTFADGASSSVFVVSQRSGMRPIWLPQSARTVMPCGKVTPYPQSRRQGDRGGLHDCK